jgi:uncharacterized protein (TIGR00369 family)
MPTPRPVERLRETAPPFLTLLGAYTDEVDALRGRSTLSFRLGEQFCHSGDVVQGGFITAMLDAAMSQALFAHDDTVIGVSSLEISTRYLEVTRAGPLQALGRIVRLSYRTAFTEAELRDAEGRVLATAQMVSKVGRRAVDGREA